MAERRAGATSTIAPGGASIPTASIGTSESPATSEPWLPPPSVVAAGEVGELDARPRRRRAARPRSGSRARPRRARARRGGRGALRRRSSASRRRPARSGAPRRRAGRPPRRPRGRATTSTAAVAVEPAGELAGVVAAARQPVDHAGAVRAVTTRSHAGEARPRSRDRRARPASGRGRSRRSRRSARGTRPARRPPRQRADGRVAARERLVRRVRARARARRSRSREVVDEEVEAVAGDEPAPDGGGVGVDRAARRGCGPTSGAPVTSDSKRL